MTRLLFTLVIFCTSLTILAAADYPISLRDHRIELPGFDYRIVRVVDGRSQQYCIGMVQRGMANKRTPAVLEEGLEAAFSGLFERSFSQNAGGQALVVRINQLQVYEITFSNTETAIAEINMSFLIPAGDGFIEIAETGVTTEKVGLEVSKKHDNNIVAATQQCLEILLSMRLKGLLREIPVAAGQLAENRLSALDYPVLTDAAPKKGVFLTFSDFCNNYPASGNMYELRIETKESRKNKIVRAKPEWINGKPKEDIWAISDGKDIFLHLGADYIKLEKKDGQFVFLGPQAKDNSGVVLIGTLFGGILGGLLAAALSDISPADLSEYKIDLATSAIVPLEEPVYRKIESRITFIGSEFNAPGKDIILFVEGQQHCVLPPGTAYKLRLPPPEKPIEICIQVGDKKICEMIEPALFKTKLLLFRAKKDKLYIDQPDGDARGRLLTEVASGALRQVCKTK